MWGPRFGVGVLGFCVFCWCWGFGLSRACGLRFRGYVDRSVVFDPGVSGLGPGGLRGGVLFSQFPAVVCLSFAGLG